MGKRTRWLLGIICVLFVFWIIPAETVKAGTYDNAYDFYGQYGSEMAFRRGSNNEGEIYYATKAKKSDTSVKYTTLGWKVTVKDSTEKTLDTFYYKLGGSNMVTVDTRTISGYEYCLYKVTLTNMKSRMSSETKEALSKADCNILFDACTTTKINGTVQGGMTDSGPSWGKVYTTYEGIVSAEDWSSATKETLKTYYNKEVEGLFYTVTLERGTGIAKVSGAGKYCFGTKVTISASASNGYVFGNWKKDGKVVSTSNTMSFTLYDSDVKYTAIGKKDYVKVNFYMGVEEDEEPIQTVYYARNTEGQAFTDFALIRDGFQQVGWSHTKGDTTAAYTKDNGILTIWLEIYKPEVNLYAVWEPNTYHIVYDANGGNGTIESDLVSYTDIICLPLEGYERNGRSLMGWSRSKYGGEASYALGEEVVVSSLVNSYGLQNFNNSTITLYAVWDKGPIISGSAIFVSLKDAQEGKITEYFLTKFVSARDSEDGMIYYGYHENNAFYMTNYKETDFTGFQKEGYITETFCAIDSSGNITKKNIPVYIVDTTVYDEELIFGYVRFIDKAYYKDENGNFVDEELGGLLKKSIWRQEDFSEKLDHVLVEEIPIGM